MSIRQCVALIGLLMICVGTFGFVFQIVTAPVWDLHILVYVWPMYLLVVAGTICYEIFRPKGK